MKTIGGFVALTVALLLAECWCANASDWELRWRDEFNGCPLGKRCPIDDSSWMHGGFGTTGYPGDVVDTNTWVETNAEGDGVLHQQISDRAHTDSPPDEGQWFSAEIQTAIGLGLEPFGQAEGQRQVGCCSKIGPSKRLLAIPATGLGKFEVRLREERAAGVEAGIWLQAPLSDARGRPILIVAPDGWRGCVQSEFDLIENGSAPDHANFVSSHINQYANCILGPGQVLEQATHAIMVDLGREAYDDGGWHTHAVVWGEPFVRHCIDEVMKESWAKGEPALRSVPVHVWPMGAKWTPAVFLRRSCCAVDNALAGLCQVNNWWQHSAPVACSNGNKQETDYVRFWTCPDVSCPMPDAQAPR